MNNNEFIDIIEKILTNKAFLETKNASHHGMNRYDHSLRVAFFTYKITKKLKLNYIEATRGALLHDFFLDEVKCDGKIKALRKHPSYAFNNAMKYYDLTDLEADIIKTHMFPVTWTPPKYFESWIVDLVDDIISIYERFYAFTMSYRLKKSVVLFIIVNILRFK